MPPDPKVQKMETRFTSTDGGFISNKLDTPKRVPLPKLCFYKESVSESNEGQVYIDHNNTSVALPTTLHPVIYNVYTSSNLMTNPNQKQHPLCQNQTLALAARKVAAFP